MAELRSEIEQVGTRTVVHLDGELSVRTASEVRLTLLKCLIDQPDALVVDLAALTVREPVALLVFRAVARQAAMWPGTPIALSVPQAELARRFSGYGRLAVFASVERALAAQPRQGLPSLGDSLLPISGAPARARELAAEVCSRWELPHLRQPAQLVTGELATNAMVHAHTIFDVRITLGRRHLLIAVRDGSPEVPRLDFGTRDDPATGRGLMLIDAVAERWGSRPVDGGKVVWAHLGLRLPLA
ncbi:ATP-binding protein [Paractinoplanes maris]|uniref:ATP-binding protein n=1 Tax=Paractinoplanes maris TaxID=1734446 RepID=UPI0020223E7C|nr:ATP-binding protein [Actinoplanes maris]